MENVNKLSDEELGKRLAEAVGYKVKEDEKFHGIVFEYKTDKRFYTNTAFLCKSLDEIAEVEKIVIERCGFLDLMRGLDKALDLSPIGLSAFYFRHLWLATPRQRAEACLAALESIKGVAQTK